MLDEQERTDKFVDAAGGTNRADQLMRIWNNSYKSGTAYDMLMGKGKSKEQVFTAKAKQNGFSNKVISMFLSL